MNQAQTISKLIPLELALIEVTDGRFSTSEAIIAFDSSIGTANKDDPDFRSKVRILSHKVGNEWRNSDGVSKWLAVAVQELVQKVTPSDDVASV